MIVEDVEAFRSRYPRVLSPVVAPDSWPRLNDGGDAVVVKDATGAVVDSVVYGRQEVSAPGRSLERIDPAGGSTDAQNWLLSTEVTGATPGRANSVLVQGDTVRVVLIAFPNPFLEQVKITYQLPVSQARVNLWVFDRLGRQVKTLLNAEPGGSQRQVDWDGAGEDGEFLKPGIYILYLEAAASDDRIYRASVRVVLAKGL